MFAQRKLVRARELDVRRNSAFQKTIAEQTEHSKAPSEVLRSPTVFYHIYTFSFAIYLIIFPSRLHLITLATFFLLPLCVADTFLHFSCSLTHSLGWPRAQQCLICL